MNNEGKCTPRIKSQIALGTYPWPYCRIGLKRGEQWTYKKSGDVYITKRRNMTIFLTPEMFDHYMEIWNED